MISIPDVVVDVNINILYLVFSKLRAKKGVGSTNDCQRPFAFYSNSFAFMLLSFTNGSGQKRES